MKRCEAQGCTTNVEPGYFMCAPHWRLVPREVKALFRASVSDWQDVQGRRRMAAPDPEAEDFEALEHARQEQLAEFNGALAAIRENAAEVVRIVAAVEAGVPA